MIKGSLVALVTPMKDQGEVDYEKLEYLLNLHLKANTSAIVIAGSTGEASTLDVNEQANTISFAAKLCAGRMPIIAGVGASCTAEAIDLAAMAKSSGAEVGLAVVPYYVRPNQKGMIMHFEAVARATDLPQILYNIPSRTGVDMCNETLLELAKNPLIVGVKDATSDMARAAELIHAVPEGFACYAGDDNITFAYMALGGHGSISVAANVVPKLFSEMCGLVLKGNLLEARALNAKLIPLYKALSTEINPIPIKYILSKMGWMENKLRLPLIAIDEKKAAAIDSLIGGILPV